MGSSWFKCCTQIPLVTLPTVLNPQWESGNLSPPWQEKGGTFKPHCSATLIYSLFQPKAGM